jgi:trimeric autotransporter adhesin
MKNNLLTLTFLTLVTVLTYSPSQAQTFSTVTGTEFITGGNSGDYGSFEWRDNGILISKGTGTTPTSSLLATDQGAGTRFLWYPKKAALRAGTVSGTGWDEANIGQGSVVLGLGSAAGQNAFSAGGSAQATGYSSVAIGNAVTVTGTNSIAAGGFFNTISNGLASVVGGTLNSATGYGSSIFNSMSSTASGGNSLILGGVSSLASGTYSTAVGSSLQAQAANVITIGRYNVGGYTNNNNGNAADDGDTQWIATDPLFEVGNGQPGTMANYFQPIRSNALTIYKNGNATFQGVVKVAPGGDIPMYTGN